MKLYPYQLEYYQRKSNFDITNKSRKIGFSSGCFSPKAVRRCLSGIDQMLLSSSQRQSNELMRNIELYIENILKRRGLKLLKDTSELKIFPNGKAIHCLPSKPETVRGFTGDVRFDEFTMHKQDREIFEAMLPTIVNNSNYQLSVASTPLGCSNMFYEIFTNHLNKYPDFVRNQINCWDAIRMGCKMNIEKIRNNFDEDSFRQEFECEFLDESTSFFPYDLLKSCIDDEYETVYGRSCQGIDVGRTGDKFCSAVTTESKSKYYLSALEAFTNKPFDVMKFAIRQQYQQFNVRDSYQDKGAIGYQMAEELEKELIGYKGCFTNQINFMNDVVTFTKMLMEQGKFKMKEDRNVINAFHKIKKTTTTGGAMSFKIERDKNGHGDEAVAIMLSLFNFKEDSEPNMAFFDNENLS